MPNPYKEIEEAFHHDGFQLAGRFLTDLNSENIFLLYEEFYAVLNDFLESFISLAQKEQSPCSCGPSCFYCCTQAVFLSPPEAFYLAEGISRLSAASDTISIKSQVEKKYQATKNLHLGKVLNYQQACPLLMDKNCMCYQHRPVACRIYLSMDLNSCIKQYQNPNEEKKFARLFELPLRAGRMMNEGILDYLREKKLSVPEMTIESALYQIQEKSIKIYDWLIGGEQNNRHFKEEEKS